MMASNVYEHVKCFITNFARINVFIMSVKLAALRSSGLAASIKLVRSFYDQFQQTGALLIAVNQI